LKVTKRFSQKNIELINFLADAAYNMGANLEFADKIDIISFIDNMLSFYRFFMVDCLILLYYIIMKNIFTSNLNCPISFNKIDSNVTRLAGFFTLLLLWAGLYYSIIFWILTFDFLMRATVVKYSILARTSKLLLSILKIEPVPIDRAPKVFAARMGFTFSLTIAIFTALQYNTITLYLMIVFSIPIILEAFLAFCVGCHIYSFIQFIRRQFV